jgi:hypothetical protein
VAYYRHSAQDRQENSIPIQRDQVREWAEKNGVEIIHEFADAGKSGLKVWRGCIKIAEQGYWAGGPPPYGMQRLLLDEKREPLHKLQPGQRKGIQNQRVTLVEGENDEVNAAQGAACRRSEIETPPHLDQAVGAGSHSPAKHPRQIAFADLAGRQSPVLRCGAAVPQLAERTGSGWPQDNPLQTVDQGACARRTARLATISGGEPPDGGSGPGWRGIPTLRRPAERARRGGLAPAQP